MVLAELMRAERLSGRKLARLSNMSHTVPSLVLTGKTRPEPETLLNLARGLATDPYSKEVDQAKFAAYAERLFGTLDLPKEISVSLRPVVTVEMDVQRAADPLPD